MIKNLVLRRPRKDSTVLKLGLIAVFLIYYMAAAITRNEELMFVIHILRVGLAIGVIWRFKDHWGPAWSAHRLGKVDVMALAVFSWSIGTLIHATYSLLWRLLGRPDIMMLSDWNGVAYVFGIMALAGLNYTQRNERNEIPRANIAYTVLVFFIGICAGALVVLYHEKFLHWLPIPGAGL